MNIWVDADACPKDIKEILYRAAMRTEITTHFVANQLLVVPQSPFIKRVKVPAGFDVADNYIVQNLQARDLVITADIPLADAVIDKNGIALNPRGELYTKENIKQCLSMRNFNSDLRDSGIQTGGPAKLSKKDNQIFANRLDQFLARLKKIV